MYLRSTPAIGGLRVRNDQVMDLHNPHRLINSHALIQGNELAMVTHIRATIKGDQLIFSVLRKREKKNGTQTVSCR